MLESLFSFLFKYRPAVFEQGRLALRPPVPAWLIIGLALVAVGVAAFTYLRAAGKASRRERVAMIAVRAAAIALLTFALLRPMLLLSSVVPQQNWLAVIIDDSRSMRITDAAGRTRGEQVASVFTDPASPLVRALRERFQLRYFRFAEQARRYEPGEALSFAGGATRMAPALDAARSDLGSLPLSGVVLVTDGADNATAGLSESLLSLKAAGIPVFTVGVGERRFARDIELGRVTVPRTALRGSALVVDLLLSQTGMGGRKVPLRVEDDGRIIAVQEVTLPAEGTPGTVRVQFTLDEPGARRVKFRVPVQAGEQIAQNNEQEAIIVVRDRREKILYFEGEPRWEFKFLRRAVVADSSLQLVSLQRTANNKYLRLDVDSAGELYGGFPRTREELFQYRALVLGSIEASYFSHDQLQMIADFVAERGGGLLVLGGRAALAEGGYAGTPVADALPLTLDGRHRRDTTYFAELRVRPTRAGLAAAALRLPGDGDAATRWEKLPALTTVNHVGAPKPGATVLLTGRIDGGGEQVVLAQQRYGRGLALALPVQDTWLWQMHADVTLEDQSHELFWRQLLRWLVNDVPDPVLASTASDRAAPGEPVRIAATINDDRFLRVNDARVTASVTTPAGEVIESPLDWALDQDGEYRGTFTPAQAGMYEVRVRSERAGVVSTSTPAYVSVSESNAEFFGAQRREPLLRRIAEESGGRYYDAARVGGLAEDVAYGGRGVTVPEERDLWDMPIVLMALLLLLAGEWVWRRKRGLA